MTCIFFFIFWQFLCRLKKVASYFTDIPYFSACRDSETWQAGQKSGSGQSE
jgi:hypothetical protein